MKTKVKSLAMGLMMLFGLVVTMQAANCPNNSGISGACTWDSEGEGYWFCETEVTPIINCKEQFVIPD